MRQTMIIDDLLITALKASLDAGHEILKVYHSNSKVTSKKDGSPLTEADLIANQRINFYLEKTHIPIISEENQIVPYSKRKYWTSCWLVDPLDGTKEFLKKNGEFTVNIALVENGELKFGVIYVPVTNELYYTNSTKSKSYKSIPKKKWRLEELFQKKDMISPLAKSDTTIKVVVSKSHINDETMFYLKALENTYANVKILSRGSSLKFCLVAEGAAHIYPRFGPTMEWDTAAGQAICESVGLNVIDQKNLKKMRYNRENILNNHFLVTI